MRCRAIIKRFLTVLLITALLASTGDFGLALRRADAANKMKGVWFSFLDHQTYLKGKNKYAYDQAFEKFCRTAVSYGLNTVFVHVRSHNDAVYPSRIYPWSSEMLSGRNPGFDPLEEMVEIAHKNGLDIHAWINPYGFRNGEYCGNAALATNDNIVAGVTEILDKYDVDGIHFDDYFPPVGASKINSMVSRVHTVCANHDRVFGISPQGNIENCLASDADIKTWLSKPGYIDYIAPQIYWTDNYGSGGNQTLSSTRLAAWKELNKAGVIMYVGMALYRAGEQSKSDPGWYWNTNNLSRQSSKAQNLGYKGYILYNAASMLEPNSFQQKELINLR